MIQYIVRSVFAALIISMTLPAFSAGDPLPAKVGEKYGFIDHAGKMVIEANYQQADFFSEGMARIKKEGKVGFINSKGEVVIEPQFGAKTGSFHEGLCKVQDKNSDKVGFMNAKGEMVIPVAYEDATDFSEGLAGVYNGRHWAYVDKNGKFVIDWQYQEALPFYNGAARIRLNDLYGFINTEQAYVIIPDVGYLMAAEKIQNGIAGVFVKGKGWGFFDEENEPVIEFKYRNKSQCMPLMSEGLINVMDPENKKYGFIDLEENFKIKASYDEARPFVNGLAAVKKGEKWGYINPAGEVVVNFIKADDAGNFNADGVAAIMKDGEWNSYVNNKGKLFWDNGVKK